MALTPTWESIDLPVLEASIASLESVEPGMPVGLYELQQATGLEDNVLLRAVQRLSHEHLVVEDTSTLVSTEYVIRDVTPKGLRAAGVWPSEGAAADAFLKALDQQIEEAPEGSSKKSALESIKDSAKSVTEGTLTAVIAAAVKGAAGF